MLDKFFISINKFLQHFLHHDNESKLYTQCTAKVLVLYELLAEGSTSGMTGDLIYKKK